MCWKSYVVGRIWSAGRTLPTPVLDVFFPITIITFCCPARRYASLLFHCQGSHQCQMKARSKGKKINVQRRKKALNFYHFSNGGVRWSGFLLRPWCYDSPVDTSVLRTALRFQSTYKTQLLKRSVNSSVGPCHRPIHFQYWDNLTIFSFWLPLSVKFI